MSREDQDWAARQSEPEPRQEGTALRRVSPDIGRDRLLGFYDRLRRRITNGAAAKPGSAGARLAETLLVVPDIFLLLVRLALDRETPKETRALIGGALAYFLLPFDLLPEGLVGPVGYGEDLVLAVAVLASAMDRRLEKLASRHWSGSEELRIVLQDTLEAARAILGKNLYGRLRRLLARWGVRL